MNKQFSFRDKLVEADMADVDSDNTRRLIKEFDKFMAISEPFADKLLRMVNVKIGEIVTMQTFVELQLAKIAGNDEPDRNLEQCAFILLGAWLAKRTVN